MQKVTVKIKPNEDMTDKLMSEIDKYKAKGYVICIAGYDWFYYKKHNQTKTTN